MSTDTFRDCVIVGNGTSVLDAENGARIDEFRTVVRFNLFETKGFEKHVGTKTDVWFCGLPMKPDDWRMQRSYREIILHSWHRDENKCPIAQRFRELLPNASIEKVRHAVLDDMARFADTTYWHWSTGAIAVWLLAQRFPLLHLTGFDWWERDAQHYFMPKAHRGTLHKPEIEKVLIERMRSEGRLEFL